MKEDGSPQDGPDGYPPWDLADFNGTGEYVSVTAVIDDIQFRWKDEPRIPDVRGELTDDSVLNPVTFIVTDDVDHPRLEEGQKYQLIGVKDHFYKKAAETQVMITEETRFEAID